MTKDEAIKHIENDFEKCQGFWHHQEKLKEAIKTLIKED